MEQRHLLILGAPRSGTSLLASIIGKHTDFGVLYEDYGFSLTKILAKKYVGNKLCLPNQIEFTKKRKRLKSMAINFFLRLRPFSTIFSNMRYPLSFYSVDDYLRLKNIKVVAVIRNGNDVISSIMKRGGRDFKTASYWWTRAVDIIYELWERHPDKVCLVSFDELVRWPKKTIMRVANFLEVDFQEDMLEGYKYTPVYKNETSIDPERAHKNKNDENSFDIEGLFPGPHSKYIKMLNSINQASINNLRLSRISRGDGHIL